MYKFQELLWISITIAHKALLDKKIQGNNSCINLLLLKHGRAFSAIILYTWWSDQPGVLEKLLLQITEFMDKNKGRLLNISVIKVLTKTMRSPYKNTRTIKSLLKFAPRIMIFYSLSLFKSWSSCFLICYMHSEEQNFNEVKNTTQDVDFFMQKMNVFTASLSTLTASPECLTLWNWNCSWSHHFLLLRNFQCFSSIFLNY